MILVLSVILVWDGTSLVWDMIHDKATLGEEEELGANFGRKI